MESKIENRGILPEKTLVVKAIGGYDELQVFISDLPKIYSRQNITFSHIIKNRGNPGYHVFINIILTPSNSKETRQ